MLLALASIWGASFMFIKVCVRGGLAPSTLVLLRLALGALTLAPIVLVRVGAGEAWRQLRSAAVPLALTGAVNSAIPIWSLSWAETRIDSGLAAVIQASAPLFTALLALAFARSERVRGARLGGLLVGFAGVTLLIGAQPHGKVTAGLAVTFSAVCYSIAALYAARTLRHVSPLVTALGALAAASILMLPGGVAQWPSDAPSGRVLASLLVLGVLGTGFAYVLYYGLLAGPGASYSILVTYLVPAIALAYGVVLLGEPLTVAAVAGLALVLLGVALGTGTLRRRRRAVATEVPA
jgi:drug/metabolite transporter (DMT)-like permease